VGESGIGATKQLRKLAGLNGLERLRIAHLSHQIFSNHSDLINQADFVILPQHAINTNFMNLIRSSKSRLFTTQGVFHHLQQKEIQDAYAKFQDLVPPARNYIAVILAGDAPSPEGQIQFFSKIDAQNLARWIASFANRSHSTLLVLNGPRTGKYDPRTNQAYPDVHRKGVTDSVTTAFMKEVRSRMKPQKVALYDFQFDQPSHYKTVLGILQHRPGSLFVPGESTSMISEVIDFLPKQIILYENNAMNSTHKAHAQSEYQTGRVQLLTQDFRLLSRKPKNREGINNQSIVKSMLHLIENEATPAISKKEQLTFSGTLNAPFLAHRLFE
jgi:hypothetical protein